MDGMRTIEGRAGPIGEARIAIVASRFNDFIVEHLLRGCTETLERHGVAGEAVTLVRVPGAFEMPAVARRLAARGEHAVIIALGAVIRGATPHFDYVAGSCTRGLAAVASDYGLPVVFGVLTVDSIEQAIERSGSKHGNKGSEAAQTALEMIDLMNALGP